MGDMAADRPINFDPERTETLPPSKEPSGISDSLLTKRYRPILICLAGDQRGVRYKLDHMETVLGRSRDLEYKLDDMQASRRHFKITYKNIDNPTSPPICILEDMGSRNGTELNGATIQVPCVLQEGDRIGVGRTIFGFFLRDEMELRQHESLYRRATRDALTGLHNRQQIDEFLTKEVDEARKRRVRFCFMLLDIDHFKKINDTYGHAVGDMALRHLANLLGRESRETDFLARWGGEEFAVVLTETSPEEALPVAERIRTAVQSSPLNADDNTAVRMTISIGVATFRSEDTLESLFKRADECLYEAKANGRNRVIFHDYRRQPSEGG